MSEIPQSAKNFAAKYMNKRGIVDFYLYLGISRTATAEEIDDAIFRKVYSKDSRQQDGYLDAMMLQIASKHLSTDESRAEYDKKLTTPWERALDRADTRAKRIALTAFPFFAVASMFRLYRDMDDHETSLTFFLFTMAAALCLAIAFTKLGDWLRSE